MPNYLPKLRAKDPGSKGRVKIPPVRILVHPEAIRVSYTAVRDLVPSLWKPEEGRKVDLMLHIGMAGRGLFYSVERRGHRDGYKIPDVDNEICEDTKHPKHDKHWIWNGVPDELKTDLDVDNVLTRWKELSPVSHTAVQRVASQLTYPSRENQTSEYPRMQEDISATSFIFPVSPSCTRPTSAEGSSFSTFPPSARRACSQKAKSLLSSSFAP